MKEPLWNVTSLMVALLAAGSAMGQSNRGITIANSPFAFTVGSQQLPAGRYSISRANATDLPGYQLEKSREPIS